MNATKTAKRPVVVIGGSGFAEKLNGEKRVIETPHGPVATLVSEIGGRTVFGIRRHGLVNHSIPPHAVPFFANIWVAKDVEAEGILASTAVGVTKAAPPKGQKEYAPGDLILCHDLIALGLYLGGKPVTYYADGFPDGPKHADCSELFSRHLNRLLTNAAAELGIDIYQGAVLATTPGPRYESPAEVRALTILLANLLGMTAGYEAILARELGIPYAAIAIGTNWAAGVTDRPLSHDEVKEMMNHRSDDVFRLITKAIELM